jgi:hypothetical protein
VITVPSTKAETVTVSSAVELNVAVATPLELVGAAGCVSAPLPVAASTTVAPLIGFPWASCAVTVMVEVPLPTAIEIGAAATVDWLADTDPGATVTVAIWVIAVPLAVAETVLVSATVELSVPVATPAASVGPAGCVTVFPDPVTESTTVAPLIGLPLASVAVTVIVVVPLPAVIELEDAVTVD